MSFSRYLNDLKKMEADLDQQQAASSERGFHRSDEADLETPLDELLEDLTDYSSSNGDSPLTAKLQNLKKREDEHSFGHQRSSVTEVRARTLRIIRVLETFGRRFLDDETQMRGGMRPEVPEENTIKPVEVSKKVFVVHGHDNSVLFRVKETLATLGLKPIVLREQPNGGQTVIEKFEQYSDVGFAVVLMTADDMGGSLSEIEEDKASPRARQNVVMELGFFASRLGRDKICVLKSDGVEAPSDIMGVVYTPIDAAEAWRLSLAQELNSAGYDIDLNKLI